MVWRYIGFLRRRSRGHSAAVTGLPARPMGLWVAQKAEAEFAPVEAGVLARDLRKVESTARRLALWLGLTVSGLRAAGSGPRPPWTRRGKLSASLVCIGSSESSGSLLCRMMGCIFSNFDAGRKQKVANRNCILSRCADRPFLLPRGLFAEVNPPGTLRARMECEVLTREEGRRQTKNDTS
jgi:hypothetical protein